MALCGSVDPKARKAHVYKLCALPFHFALLRRFMNLLLEMLCFAIQTSAFDFDQSPTHCTTPRSSRRVMGGFATTVHFAACLFSHLAAFVRSLHLQCTGVENHLLSLPSLILCCGTLPEKTLCRPRQRQRWLFRLIGHYAFALKLHAAVLSIARFQRSIFLKSLLSNTCCPVDTMPYDHSTSPQA